MKAHIYLVFKNGYWHPCLTIAPEVDRLYWSSNEETGLVEHGERVRRTSAAVVCFWRSALPLGEAVRAVAMMEDVLGVRQLGKGGVIQEELEVGQLVGDVMMKEMGELRRLKKDAALGILADCVKKLDVGRQAASMEMNRENAGQLAEWWDCSEGANIGAIRYGMREEFMSGRLLARAMYAAELLEGRALVRSEAQVLLEGAMGPEASDRWSEWLQLAALNGRVRLRGAVAAVSRRQGAHWRRRRERGGSVSCLRCGSGEAQLQRTPCEACGRLCAYCASCIALGRSRECELLVLGQRAWGLGDARRLLPVERRLERWALSPAQAAAAKQALRHVESEDDGGRSRTTVSRVKGWMTKVISINSWEIGRRWKTEREAKYGSEVVSKEGSKYLNGNISKQGSQCWDRKLGGGGKRQWGGSEDRDSTDRDSKDKVNEYRESKYRDSEDRDNKGKGYVALRSDISRNEEKYKAKRSPAVQPNKAFLLWAVTGAGKTEMIFPLLESVLLRGGKALLATPRRDVVIELDPRIRKAFPEATVVTLYGGSEQRWERGDITLSTTHQLIRFQEAFDLVIIDELDAFPYVNDPVLHFAADKSCTRSGARVLLSATPPTALQREAKKGRLPHARVPVRYHRHPLPVPVLLYTSTVAAMLQKRRLPSTLVNAIQKSLDRGAQLFIFLQRIAQTEPMAALLRSYFAKNMLPAAIAATSSQDPDRALKVRQFRDCSIRILVTTTILERGVTIPRSDVYIMDADGRLFDEASLVQMAGRAGRSSDDPFGAVYFCSKERNRSQIAAVKQIRTMNKIAKKHGYLHEKKFKMKGVL